MIELHLLRHAHAGDPASWDGPDERRPLSDKGERQAERLAGFLAGIGFQPDAIITSPKVRAARTAEIVAARLNVQVRPDGRLAGPLALDTLNEVLDASGAPERPLIVGHDPDLTELLAALCGASNIPMRKGSLARIDSTRPFEPGGGVLRWLVPPDLLRPDR